MKRMVILASGNGSNFEAIVKTARKEKWPVEIVSLITDNPHAYAIKRAKRLRIPCKLLNYKEFDSKDSYNKELFKILKEFSPDLIVLAGYMRILPLYIVRAFRWKIVNIHPALLPAFRGLHAIERAYKAGCKVTGVTVHFVDEGVDTGPIIAQRCIEIREGESLEHLERRIHRVEHKLYPTVIKKLLFGDE